MLVRVQKILAERGIASRRKCEEYIANGRVKVNGVIIKLGDKADSEKDIILFDDASLPKKESFVYIMLNKPRGYVTTVTEPFGMPTVMDLIRTKERVYPVGRLDKNSEGLLILTNDGELTLRLTHPRHGVSKIYHIRLDRNLAPEDMQKLHAGVRVEGKSVFLSGVHRIKPHELTVTIHEGRKHVVRKLFEEINYVVTKLTRITFGPLVLKNLKPGQWRYLSKEEVYRLKTETPQKEKKKPKPVRSAQRKW